MKLWTKYLFALGFGAALLVPIGASAQRGDWDRDDRRRHHHRDDNVTVVPVERDHRHHDYDRRGGWDRDRDRHDHHHYRHYDRDRYNNHHDRNHYGHYYPQPHYRQVVVRPAPPPVRYDARPHCHYQNGVWVEGNWEWNGAQYVWRPGYWIEGRHGQRYVQAQWSLRAGEWVLSAGYWAPDENYYYR